MDECVRRGHNAFIDADWPALPDLATMSTAAALELPGGPVLAYEDDGSGPAVLFSHGLFMSRRMFDPQVAALRERYRCITWDERSHGDTAWRGDYDFYDSARDAIALLDHLGIEQAVFCGMSQGGILSLRAALIAPERVRAIVMIDSQAGVTKGSTGGPIGTTAEAWTEHGPRPVDADWLANLILGPGVDPAPWREYWTRLRPYQAQDAVRTLLARDDVTDRLGEIEVPVLVIHGTADESTTIERSRAVADGVPDCRGLVLIEGAPHASNLSHPGEVNAAILEFLQHLGPTTKGTP